MIKQQFLADEAQTLDFGKRLALAIMGQATAAQSTMTEPKRNAVARSLGAVIYLTGDLGAGKTTLARGFIQGYGHTGPVKSPTYTLVEPYEFEHGNVYHFDLYRLADPEEVEFLGVDDYFEEENVCLFEWPLKGSGRIPAADLFIELSDSGTGRTLSCRIQSEKGTKIAARLWR
ncbi:MAG: tRNA threonylcarbamoyladenosine biosynthesis protein TsaE [Pseudohongiellaceae bacterium]|jgi:tRNA threonylcarbamoyladenosine biosynthesis protein TsaE